MNDTSYVERVGKCTCGMNMQANDPDLMDSFYPQNRERTVWGIVCQVHNNGCGREVYAPSKEEVVSRWNAGETDDMPSDETFKGSLRLQKKKRVGIFKENYMTVSMKGLYSLDELDDLLDLFDENYQSMVPIVKTSYLRKCFRNNTFAVPCVTHRTPDKSRICTYVSFGDSYSMRLTFDGPSYSLNSATKYRVVSILSDLFKTEVKLEEFGDAWYPEETD